MSEFRLAGAVPVMAEQCQAIGANGAVAAAAPIAAVIGIEILRSGGNAYDAAVAAALAETVLLPPKCGLAGDLIALAWRRGDQTPDALLAIGGAPAGLADIARRGELRPTGPMAVGVPGAPAGYVALAARARLPLATLVAPAIDLAQNGFPWSRICSALAAESTELVARYNARSRYFPDGNVIPPGDLTRLPGLADLLVEFAEKRGDLLKGDVGRAIEACVAHHGGVLRQADFDSVAAEWIVPEQANIGRLQIFVTPVPTHGPALLSALAELPENAAHPASAVLPCVMRAIEYQRHRLADPSGTSMVSAVDSDGTMVSVVHSNSYPRFGSGLIVEKYDLILANRAGRGFSSDPQHPNFPVKGRRPATTLHAWAVATHDQRRLQGGTPGGANQMPWNAQTLARLIAGETDIGRLIVAPRWEWLPTEDAIRVERGFTDVEYRTLAACGMPITEVDRWGSASAMQIIADDPDRRTLRAAADPRTVGLAVAC